MMIQASNSSSNIPRTPILPDAVSNGTSKVEAARSANGPIGSAGKSSTQGNGAVKSGNGPGNSAIADDVKINLSGSSPSPNGRRKRLTFQTPYGACNFIVTWDGEDVYDLLDAIEFARDTGDRFIQDKLIEYILNIPFTNPRPNDIPAFVGKPVWAVDQKGNALIGMPGNESIVTLDSLRDQIRSQKTH